MNHIKQVCCSAALMLILVFAGNPVSGATDGCFLLVDQSAGLDPVVVQNVAIPIISSYVEAVKPIPQSGLREKDCRYTISLTAVGSGMSIAVSGRKLNSLASSDFEGVRGCSQALLRAVHKTFSRESLKNRICQQYPTLLATDCQMVESLFYLYDANGNKIQSGQTVRSGDRFYVLIKPLSSLHAYVINKDSRDNLFVIFPNARVTDIPNPLNAHFQYIFPAPDSDLVFEFDDRAGTEKFYFVFSAVPLREITRYFSSGGDLKVSEFEERILTRGINLVTQKKDLTIKLPNNSYQKKRVESLSGKGVMVREIVLQHR